MAYIGREPQIGNFQVCDAISVVNGQAAYTMQVNSVNVSPETANHMLVSLNGVIQKPGSSYTVSGSTITFASNLATGDVINFIHILGSVLDLGVPSNDTVGAAQIKDDLISGTTALASEPADTDEFLVSDAGTLKRIDYSLIKSSPTHVLLSTSTVSSGVSELDITSNIDSTYKNYMVTYTEVHPSSDGQVLKFRVFNGGSVNTSAQYTYASKGRLSNGSDAQVSNSGNDQGELGAGNGVGSANNESISGFLILHNPSSTTFYKMIQANSIHIDSSSRMVRAIDGIYVANTAAVDGVRFYFGSGNIDSGVFKLYGIN